MAPLPTPPPPGSMTVPPLSGWEDILTVVAVVVVVAVLFLVTMAAGVSANGRSEWQAWLDARSSGAEHPATGPYSGTAESVLSESVPSGPVLSEPGD